MACEGRAGLKVGDEGCVGVQRDTKVKRKGRAEVES